MTNPTPAPWWRDFNREHWFVFSIASLAWLFDCLDQQFFNLARDAAMEDLMPTKALANEYGPCCPSCSPPACAAPAPASATTSAG